MDSFTLSQFYRRKRPQIDKLVGKYFRLFCIIAFPAFVLYWAWLILSRAAVIFSSGVLVGIIVIGFWLFLIVISALEISFLRWQHEQKIEPSYEGWGVAFYILIVGVLIYISLKLISGWIGFDLVQYLKNSFGL